MSMVEPRGKKVAFLKHVCRRLALTRAEVIPSDLAAIDGRSWDVATTRAVGRLASVVGEGRFLSPGGLLLVWTTHPARLSAELHGSFSLETTVPVPGSDHRAVAAFRRS
jgi:16S rRNA G527 N7-methylase RsmG